jgi:hypothetical protein
MLCCYVNNSNLVGNYYDNLINISSYFKIMTDTNKITINALEIATDDPNQINITQKYNTYKKKYLLLKEEYNKIINCDQKGGGAWGTFSSDNDDTLDFLDTYKLRTFSNDNIIYETSYKKINEILKKIFKEFDNNMKRKDPKTINTDASPYNLSYTYLGIIIDLLLNMCPVPKIYLKRVLIHAYREYFRIYTIKHASGWKSYTDRLTSLKYEIIILCYAINKGTPLDIPSSLVISTPTGSYVNVLSLVKYLTIYLPKANRKYKLDHIFLTNIKIKAKLEFQKYLYKPIINPNLLDEGTISEGHDARGLIVHFIVVRTGTRHTWKLYSSTDDPYGIYIPMSLFYAIFGPDLSIITKKKLVKIKDPN